VTDARLPERLLTDRRYLRLSLPAERLFVRSLMWAVSNRTDGVLYDDDLTMIPGVDASCAAELAKSGLWQRERDYWVVVGWHSTQTSRSDLETLDNVRRWSRETKARQRAKKAADDAAAQGVHVDSPRERPRGQSTGTHHVDDIGKARTGKAQLEEQPLTEVSVPAEVWKTAADLYERER
jgi:hypothetical protein